MEVCYNLPVCGKPKVRPSDECKFSNKLVTSGPHSLFYKKGNRPKVIIEIHTKLAKMLLIESLNHFHLELTV